MQLHRRQFVIGPRPVEAAPGWVSVALPGGGYLSHCPEVRCAAATGAEGTDWRLLGLAVQTDATRPEPLEQLHAASRGCVERGYASWAGRWALIGGGELHMDAAGLLGCFYGEHTTGDGAREVWASSSAALLAGALGAGLAPTREIKHRRGIDWYPGPRSRFEPVRRLLPSQVLAHGSGAVRPRRLLGAHPSTARAAEADDRRMSYDALLEWLQRYLVATLRKVAQLSGKLWLPLTAGYDSRLLLAAACCAGVPFETYTHAHDRMVNDADLVLPPRLADLAGVPHQIVRGGAFRPDLAALYDEHTAGHCVDIDRHYVSHQYFDRGGQGAIILRGGAFDLGHHKLSRKFPRSAFSAAMPPAEQLMRGFHARWQPALVRALNEWIAWTDEHPEPELDWRDRLYLEQRLGGWLSAIEQSLDLIDADRFYAANSHAYFVHVLRIPEAIRRPARHHVDLIRRMAPELLALPFNPPPRLHKRILTRLSRALPY